MSSFIFLTPFPAFVSSNTDNATNGLFYPIYFTLFPYGAGVNPEFMEPVRKGLSCDQMESMKIIRSPLELSANLECPICTDSLFHNEASCVRKMNSCQHAFHEECIFTWLKQSKICPLCRAEHSDRPSLPPIEVPEMVVESETPIIEELEEPIVDKPVEDSMDVEHFCGLDAINCCWESSNELSSQFVRMSECGHEFHRNCIEASNRIQTALNGLASSQHQNIVQCPTCRREGRCDAF